MAESNQSEPPLNLPRRRLLKLGTALAASLPLARTHAVASDADWQRPSDPARAASDTQYWEAVRALYAPPEDMIHLEHGNWGMMAKSVRDQYRESVDRVNHQTSYYGRNQFAADRRPIVTQLARVLGVHQDELAIVRNATEALTTLIAGYNPLRAGDAVLYADLDYSSMQGSMRWLHERRGVRVESINIPEPATAANVLDAYRAALQRNPRIRLMLLTHISHRTGLLMPVRELTELARSHNVDVILDSAHAWGQVDFRLPELGVDFAGLNLHKWIGAPLGLGLLYIKRDRLEHIDRHPVRGGGQGAEGGIYARTGVGTSDIAAQLAIPAALEIHERIGPLHKEARLRRLRDLWAERLREDERFEILTPSDPAMYAGITSFRLRGQNGVKENQRLARRLWQDHRIFTVHRDGLASGACVRVTPAIYSREQEVEKLAAALEQIVG